MATPPAAGFALTDSGQRKLQELTWVTNTPVAKATVVRMEIFTSLQRIGNEDTQRNDDVQWTRTTYKAIDEFQA